MQKKWQTEVPWEVCGIEMAQQNPEAAKPHIHPKLESAQPAETSAGSSTTNTLKHEGAD